MINRLIALGLLGFAVICLLSGVEILQLTSFGPNVINSRWDSFFLASIFFGGAIATLSFAYLMWFANSAEKNKITAAIFGIIGIVFFLCGIYYHIIFGAPW